MQDPSEDALDDPTSVCAFRVATGARHDLVELIADVIGAIDAPGVVAAHRGDRLAS